MSAALLVLAWLAPLAALPPALGAAGRWWMPMAALPALGAALLVPAGVTVDIPWLLLGVRLGLDESARVFLLFTAVLWLAAAVHAAVQMRMDPHAAHFRVFYLLAMSGNIGLIVGQDMVSFYLGFALMGLAAYGLVVHEGNAIVRRAGRVYLVMTLIGEVALFAGFVLLYGRAGSLTPAMDQIADAGSLELGLLVLAFGIKAGLIGLHLWLPLAHPAAPVPASAVLSGAMIKAALIGWMRYLPLGQQSLPEWGAILALAGAATALLALPLGLGQRDPKVVLAYSSIGSMGAMIMAVGIAAMEPLLAPAAIVAVTFYAAHHGLAKGALFLGVGVVKSTHGRWPLGFLVLSALVLAGVPFTSGAVAKDLLKTALLEVPAFWTELLAWMLPLASAGTTLLMGRFLYLMHRAAGSAAPSGTVSALPWLALAVLSLGLPLLAHGGFSFAASESWPILAAAIVAGAVALRQPAALARWVGRIPPGDVLEPLLRVSRQLVLAIGTPGTRCCNGFGAGLRKRLPECIAPLVRGTQAVDTALCERAAAGLLWLAVAVAALLLVAQWP